MLMTLLVDRAPRQPQLRVPVNRPGRHRRHQRAHRRPGQDHRLVENDEVPRQAAAAAGRPGLEEDAGHAAVEPADVDRLRALSARHLQDPAAEVRRRLDQLHQPQEVLRGRRLLVRGMNDQPLAEQEQPRELARLKDAALAVLSRDDEADAERRPPAIDLAERRRQNVALPRVQDEAGARRKLDRLDPGARAEVRNQAEPGRPGAAGRGPRRDHRCCHASPPEEPRT
jgi:hypothetical protein